MSTQASFAGVPFDHALHGRGVVERQQHHVVEHGLRGPVVDGLGDGRAVAPVVRPVRQAHFREVVGAVVEAFHFGDLRSAGEGAGRLDEIHHRLGAGVAEAHALEGRDPPAQQLREFDLDLGGHRKAAAAGDLPGHRVDHRRVGIAVDEGGHVVAEVEIAIAVHINELRALGLRNVDRVRFAVDRGAAVAVRQHPPRPLAQARGAGVGVGRIRAVH